MNHDVSSAIIGAVAGVSGVAIAVTISPEQFIAVPLVTILALLTAGVISALIAVVMMRH